MNSLIDSIVGLLMLTLTGIAIGHVYYAIKNEAVHQVRRELPSHLAGYTANLTRKRAR